VNTMVCHAIALFTIALRAGRCQCQAISVKREIQSTKRLICRSRVRSSFVSRSQSRQHISLASANGVCRCRGDTHTPSTQLTRHSLAPGAAAQQTPAFPGTCHQLAECNPTTDIPRNTLAVLLTSCLKICLQLSADPVTVRAASLGVCAAAGRVRAHAKHRVPLAASAALRTAACRCVLFARSRRVLGYEKPLHAYAVAAYPLSFVAVKEWRQVPCTYVTVRRLSSSLGNRVQQ